MAAEFPGHRLGLQPGDTTKRRLHLVDYLDVKALPAPPHARMWLLDTIPWGVMLNDTLGDCCIAELGHMVQVWTSMASKLYTPTDAMILKGYEIVGGYQPGDPSTDNGCTIYGALEYLRIYGLGGHKCIAYAYVDPQAITLVKQSIELFGTLDYGVELPISAYGQIGGVWDVPPGGLVGDGSPGSWGNHSVVIGGFDDNFLYCVTWGKIQKMTYNFFTAYFLAADAVLSHDWIRAKGISPSGFNLSQLQIDLKHV